MDTGCIRSSVFANSWQVLFDAYINTDQRAYPIDTWCIRSSVLANSWHAIYSHYFEFMQSFTGTSRRLPCVAAGIPCVVPCVVAVILRGPCLPDPRPCLPDPQAMPSRPRAKPGGDVPSFIFKIKKIYIFFN